MKELSLISSVCSSPLEALLAGLFDYAPDNEHNKSPLWQKLAASFSAAELINWPLIANDAALGTEQLPLINRAFLSQHKLPLERELFICAQGQRLDGRLSHISQERFEELEALQHFNGNCISEAIPLRVTSYEIAISGDALNDAPGLKVGLRNILSFLYEDGIRVCVELESQGEELAEALPTLCEVLTEVNNRVKGADACLKVSAHSLSSPDLTSAIITTAAAFSIATKLCLPAERLFTAKDSKVWVPGIINLSFAACLASDPEMAAIDRKLIRDCLETEKSEDFELHRDAAWKTVRIDFEKLLNLRSSNGLTLETKNLPTIDKLLSAQFGQPGNPPA